MGRKKAHGGDEDGPPVAAAGSTKSKKKALVIDDDEYAIATEPTDDSVPQEEKLVITGKKKGKKGIAKASQSKDDAVEKAAQDGEDEDPPEIVFAGKKKKGGGNSSFSASAFELLGDEDDGDDEKKVEDDDFAAAITFSGKKKKSSKKNNSLDVEAIDEDASAADEAISFSGKKKPSKKKKGHVSFAEDESEATDSVPPQEAAAVEVVVVEASKSKKKKKKSGRTAQEEDDLDMILAELGELPKPASEPVQEKETQPEAAEADEKGGEEESAAAKKKKKKKEKEKEKKAAAKEEKPVEAKTVNTKKLPKHVREMQEALARRKEAEERALKEEEEKRKREEDERLRQEEADRVAEENRRRKKEREKEKLQKKRQEGKLLTAKQKEEARRLEAMRNQILSSSGGLGLPGDTAAPTKRPLYQKKKPKLPPSSSAKLVETVEEKETQPDEADSPEEKSEVAESVEEEEEEVEDEWDAKSWDDVNISVNAFADEEADSESEPVLKKELKKSLSSSGNADKKTASSAPPEDSKKPNKAQVVAVEVTDKNKEKESDETPKGEANLRSPICCIMGHVDTGKTKLLDCIRGTNVQEGEAGGITQQIGATYFPADNIRERTKELKANAILKVPGLLIIDTPGHESFTNLRSRGSGLCDIAVLVVDIMHGLEPQTIESLNLLKMRNTEFIVALNKVDRLYGWKTQRNAPIRNSFKQQSKDVINEFNMRLRQIITQFMEQGINTELYYKNNDLKGTYNIVPTSAITGEGLPDLLLLLVNWTQRTMVEKLTFSNEVQCTVLEVKVVEGHGTTIDVVLVNGVLHEGEQIVVCGMQGPIVTTIRALLTPHPMKELRVKGTYLHHKQIKAAQGIKITAQGLEHAIAGTGLYVVGPKDDVEEIKETTMEDMKSVMSRIDRSGEGVCVQSSTLGSLEALLEFLKTPDVNIPVSGISIGPVHKKDVMKASVMLEKKKEYATILAFDVKVTPDARELAEELGVTIFMADIIYHLFDQFKAYIDNIKEEKKKESAEEAVFPCILEILPNCVFNKKDPIVLGVDVLEGIAKVGTPLCVLAKDGECVDIGRIASIENNHKPVDTAKKGLKVAIKIVGTNSEEQQKMFGRHFEMEDQLVSHISRKSIDLLKANYRDDLSMEEWRLVVKLKTLLKIQ